MPMGKRENQINSSVENARGTDISLWREGTEREIKFQIFLKGKEKNNKQFLPRNFCRKTSKYFTPAHKVHSPKCWTFKQKQISMQWIPLVTPSWSFKLMSSGIPASVFVHSCCLIRSNLLTFGSQLLAKFYMYIG